MCGVRTLVVGGMRGQIEMLKSIEVVRGGNIVNDEDTTLMD